MTFHSIVHLRSASFELLHSSTLYSKSSSNYGLEEDSPHTHMTSHGHEEKLASEALYHYGVCVCAREREDVI
jgi:hypothetical protein